MIYMLVTLSLCFSTLEQIIMERQCNKTMMILSVISVLLWSDLVDIFFGKYLRQDRIVVVDIYSYRWL